MKKWIAVFLSVVLALSCVAALPAAAEDRALLEIGTVSGKGGSRVCVPVVLKNAGALKNLGNGNVCGVEFNLSYDQSLATFVAAESRLTSMQDGGNTLSWDVDSKAYAGKNRAKIMLSDPLNHGFDAAGDVEIALLYFDLSPAGEEEITVTLTPELVDICDNYPYKLEQKVDTSAGSITITSKQYATLSAEAATAFPGKNAYLFITIENAQALSAAGNGPAAGNGTLCGLEINLNYDHDKLKLCGVSTQLTSPAPDGSGDVVQQTWCADVREREDGSVKLMVEDPERVGVSADGDIVLCALCFCVEEDVPAGTRLEVGFELIDICDTEAKQLGSFVRTQPTTITVEEQTVSDTVERVISDIQRVSVVTSVNQREEIRAARAAYDQLSEEEKAQVTNYDLLLAAEETLSALEMEEVRQRIAAIGEVSLEKQDLIIEARALYDALTPEQQAQLTEAAAVLLAAEQRLEELQSFRLGDVDGDGNVTVSDVVELRKVIVAGTWESSVFLAGNLDGDGTLSVSDVVELRKLIVAG